MTVMKKAVVQEQSGAEPFSKAFVLLRFEHSGLPRKPYFFFREDLDDSESRSLLFSAASLILSSSSDQNSRNGLTHLS